MKKILFVFMMLLFVCPFSLCAQKIEKRRHNPASKTIELPPDWEVTIAYPYEAMEYNYTHRSKYLVVYWIDCNELLSDDLVATINFVYIGKAPKPSAISTTAIVNDLVSCSLTGTLMPETGSLFSLSVKHSRTLFAEKCLPQNSFNMLGLEASGAYDKEMNSNISIKGSIEANLTTVAGNVGTEEKTKVKGNANSLVFPEKVLEPVTGVCNLSRGNDGEGGVSYTYRSNMTIKQTHIKGISTVSGNSDIGSVSYTCSF